MKTMENIIKQIEKIKLQEQGAIWGSNLSQTEVWNQAIDEVIELLKNSDLVLEAKRLVSERD